MRISHALFRCALLGSTLAVAAFATSAGASETRPDLERILAATGRHPPAARPGNAAIRSRAGSSYTVLHDFGGAPSDGSDSIAEVTFDSSGNIYGVTDTGGANNDGALFEITAGGTESLIHSFGGKLGQFADGIAPDGAVIFDADGNMYGTTETGGAFGDGTIWERAANGKYKVLHNFDGTDGDDIRGRLVRDAKGNLYGTALFGGANEEGTVFKCSARGELTVLHTFGGSDGADPEHGVIMDTAGNLYGGTAFGGIFGGGAVYEIAADGTFSTLYSFSGGADGDFLYGGLAIDSQGNLYGSTVDGGTTGCSGYGCGTIFKLAPDDTLTTLYRFTGGNDGANPEGDLLLVGKDLYGTALYSGYYGLGGVFKITTGGKEKMLQSFTTADGYGYSAGVITSGKTFYGTISGGGADGNGVVFSLTKK